MAQTRVPKAAGLWTSPSPLNAPIGSYAVADECVVDRPDIITSRRGFEWLPDAVPGSVAPSQIASFRGTLLVVANSRLYMYTGSGSSFVDFGQNFGTVINTLKNRFEETGKNCYFTTDRGVFAIDSSGGASARLSGVPQGPVPTGRTHTSALNNDVGSGWMPANAQVAYVATYQYVDAAGTPHEGTPSYPLFLTNPADLAFAPAPTTDLTKNYVDKPAGSNSPLYEGATPHGLQLGDTFTATYATSNALWPSGTYTVSVLGNGVVHDPDLDAHDFRWVDGVTNTGGAPVVSPGGTISRAGRTAQIYVDLAPNITAGYYVNLYRSFTSASVDAEPAPQYYQVDQHLVTAGDVTAGYYTFQDTIPEGGLSNPLYTNTNDGDPVDSSPDNDNARPPVCADLTQFDQRLWGAYYAEYGTVSVSLLATGAPNGLQVGDTVTVGGTPFLGVAEGVALTASTTFTVYTSSDSPATNIRNTAQSLALTITHLGTLDAYLTADEAALFQGDLLIRAKTAGVSAVSFNSSRPSAWNPVLPVSSPSSDQAYVKNGLWFSKQNEPEAVPLLNRLSVGPANCSVLRIKALRDKLYVFTDIAGTYEVSNTYPYQVTELSRTAALVAPNSLVAFNDAIYCLTTQGVTHVDESGFQVISIPIEADIKKLYGVGYSQLSQNAVAVGYESYRKYILAMPTTSDDRNNTQAFVYDAVTRAWTRWTRPISALCVVPQTDYLYTVSPLSQKVSKERKNYDHTDYADEDFGVNIASATGTAVTLSDASVVQVGDLLYQGAIPQATVIAVNGNVVTTEGTVAWTLGAATVYPGIANAVVYTPMFSGAPEQSKHYREVCFHLLSPGFTLGQATFFSDLNPTPVTISLAGQGGFGDGAWQQFSWGLPNGPKNKRVLVPSGSQRVAFLSPGFSLRQAWGQWQLLGYTPTYETGSERETTR